MTEDRDTPTDVYLAPLDTPPVEAVLDPGGHLLRIPDGYRWAGTVWRPDPETGGSPGGISGGAMWLVVHPRRLASFTDVTGEADPFDARRPHPYFRLLAVTRLDVLDQLVWQVRWLPRAAVTDATHGLVTITGVRDPETSTSGRLFLTGPGMADPAVRAALQIDQPA